MSDGLRKPGNVPGSSKGHNMPAPQGKTWGKANSSPSAPGGERIREEQRKPGGPNNKLPK